MKVAILCSWCDKPIKNDKQVVHYRGEFICRECYLNRMIDKEINNDKYRDIRPCDCSDREGKSEGTALHTGHCDRETQNWNVRRIYSLLRDSAETKGNRVIGECKQCHFPVIEGNSYYERWGQEYMHTECVEKYTMNLFRHSGWNLQKGE